MHACYNWNIVEIPSFISIKQIKIFLMKSESFLTLHRQQRNWNIVRTSLQYSMWQCFNCNVMKLRKKNFFAKKTKINTLFNNLSVFDARSREYHNRHNKYSRSFITLRLNYWCHMDYGHRYSYYLSGPWMRQLRCCLYKARKLSDFIKKYVNLCSKDERRSYGMERHEGE